MRSLGWCGWVLCSEYHKAESTGFPFNWRAASPRYFISAKFSSLQLQQRGPHLIAGHQWANVLISRRPPALLLKQLHPSSEKQVPLMLPVSVTSSSAIGWRKLFALKGPCDKIRPTWKISHLGINCSTQRNTITGMLSQHIHRFWGIHLSVFMWGQGKAGRDDF